MKGTANAIWANAAGTKEGERPSEGLQYDWAVTALSAWLVGGLYLDVWAHNHDAGVESFFTPWHAVFYSGFLAVAAYLLGTWVKNIGRGYSWKRAVPRGYTLSLLGVAIFAAGGLFDMLWHLAFGVEVSVEALLSPSHLLLALGIVLIVSGPFRAAWKRTAGTPTGLVALLPMLLSITFVLSVFAGLTEYAHPFVDLWAAQRPEGARQLPILNELYVMNADGSSQIRLTLEPEQQHSNPAWSPDGSRIVFANGAAEIYVISLDGRSQTRLTNSQGGGWKPAWSPDGNKIALSTERDGNVEVYVMNADGSEQLNLTRNGASDLWGDWSPDGKKIAFTSDRDGNDEIYVMYSDGGEVTRLTNDAAADGLPAWSPDGSEIAFTSDRDGIQNIYVMDSTGTGQRELTDNNAYNYGPAWSPDGDKIAFTSNRDGNSDVYLMNADGTAQENLTRNPGTEEGNRGVSWSPDGGRLVFTSRGAIPVDTSSLGQTIGVASVLLQSAILMGIVLVLTRRWALPFGALALVFTLSTTLVSLIHDQQWLIPIALAAGLVADLLSRQLKPSAARPWALRLFAFAVPVTLFAFYFVALSLRVGIGWSIHLWMGSIVLAGVVGLLMSHLLVPPAMPADYAEQQMT